MRAPGTTQSPVPALSGCSGSTATTSCPRRRSARWSPRCNGLGIPTPSVSAVSFVRGVSARCTAMCPIWTRGGDSGHPGTTRSPTWCSTPTAGSCTAICSADRWIRPALQPCRAGGLVSPTLPSTARDRCVRRPLRRDLRLLQAKRVALVGPDPGGAISVSTPCSGTPRPRACRPPSWTRRWSTLRPAVRSTNGWSGSRTQPASSSSTSYQRAHEADSGIRARRRPASRTSSNRSPHCARCRTAAVVVEQVEDLRGQVPHGVGDEVAVDDTGAGLTRRRADVGVVEVCADDRSVRG